MTTFELLSDLQERGIKVWADGAELGLSAPKGVLTPDLVARIKQHKSDLLELLQRQASVRSVDADAAIEPVSRDRPLSLSFSQQRLWFLAQMEPDSSTYNMPLAWTMRGALDRAAFERALFAVVARHEILRANFVSERGTPSLSVGEPVEFEASWLPFEDAAAATREESLEAVRIRLAGLAEEPFDLEADELLRPSLHRVAPDEHVFFLLVHHIVFDGWSAEVFLGELCSAYEALVGGREIDLPELPVQYADFAAWQRAFLESDELDRQMDHHRSALAGSLPLLDLPTDHPRPAIQVNHGANAERTLAPGLREKLEALAQEEGATLYMVLLAAYDVLLSRWCGQDDLCVGTIVANRSRPETHGLIGFFANTLVLRTDVSGAPTFRELLGRVRDVTLGALENQDAPFEKLVEELHPERTLAHTPLFQTLFMTESGAGRRVTMGGLELELLDLETKVARTDLMLTVHEAPDGLEAWAEYCTDLLEEDTVLRMLACYESLLEGAVRAPDTPIAELPMLASEERTWLLEDCNRVAPATRERAVHASFEARVDETPDALAVVGPALGADAGAGGEVRWTYAELDARANRIARYLREEGVEPGSLVGLALDRSAEMIAALLGIVKAGAAYVPLDPSYPRDRIAYMIEDAGLSHCVTSSDLAELVGTGVRRVELDEGGADAQAIAAQSSERLGLDVATGERMYVIYTSGSTGRPKGVELEHASVANFLASMAKEPGFRAGERLLAVTTLSFDISVLEVMLPLVSGGTVIVASRDATLDGSALIELVDEHRPHVMQATPATWRLLVLSGWKGQAEMRAFCGGEALPRDLADELLERCAELWNLYGPTETTIWSAVSRVRAGDGLVPIGHPIDGTRIYVLDERGEPTPVGVPGELFIAGAGLARGYLDRAELTAERFLPDPFVAGERMYRTGDKARWRRRTSAGDGAGELECLGRIDNQVKLRGFRIELGEIESVIEDHDAVRQCVCVIREDAPGDQRLTAYVGVAAGTDASGLEALLRQAAQDRLPGYMVPAAFVALETLPHTPNGKVDRNALLALGPPNLVAPETYVEPATDTERSVAEVWGRVLNLDPVPADTNFFDLGGHSLLLAEVRGGLAESLGIELSIIELFQYPTVCALAAYVDAKSSSTGGASGSKASPARDKRDRDLAAGRQALMQRRRIRR